MIDGENEVAETAEIEEIEAVENDTSDENPFEKIDEEVEKEEEVQAEAKEDAIQTSIDGGNTWTTQNTLQSAVSAVATRNTDPAQSIIKISEPISVTGYINIPTNSKFTVRGASETDRPTITMSGTVSAAYGFFNYGSNYNIDVIFENIIFVGGKGGETGTTNTGRAFFSNSTYQYYPTKLTLDNCKFQYFRGYNNTYGGVIYWTGGELNVNNCEFAYNEYFGGTNTSYGGAIFAKNANVNITDSNFHHNVANSGTGEGYGGAVGLQLNNDSYEAVIKNTTFSNNTGSIGGGIYIDMNSRKVTLDDVTVTENTATNYGGGVYVNSGGVVDIKGNTKISGNVCTNTAAAYANDTDLILYPHINTLINLPESLGSNAEIKVKRAGAASERGTQIGTVGSDYVTGVDKIIVIDDNSIEAVATYDNKIVYRQEKIPNAPIQATFNGGITWTAYNTLSDAILAVPAGSGTIDTNIIEITGEVNHSYKGAYSGRSFTLRSADPQNPAKVKCYRTNIVPANVEKETDSFYINTTRYTATEGSKTVYYCGESTYYSFVGINNVRMEDINFVGADGYTGLISSGGDLEFNNCRISNFGGVDKIGLSGKTTYYGVTPQYNNSSTYTRDITPNIIGGIIHNANDASSSFKMNNCVFIANKGLAVRSESRDIQFNGCVVSGNTGRFFYGVNASSTVNISGCRLKNNIKDDNAAFIEFKPGYTSYTQYANMKPILLIENTEISGSSYASGSSYNSVQRALIYTEKASVYLNNTVIKNNFSNSYICYLESDTLYDQAGNPTRVGSDLHFLGDVTIENNVSRDGTLWVSGDAYVQDNAVVRGNSTSSSGSVIGENLCIAAGGNFIMSGNLGPKADVRVKNHSRKATAFTVFGQSIDSTVSGAEKIHSDDDDALYATIINGNRLQWVKTSYKITVANGIKNGSVDVFSNASEGVRVDIGMNPDRGYEADKATYSYGGNTYDALVDSLGSFYFVMPAADVTVNATFKKVSNIPDDLQDVIINNGGDSVGIDLIEDPDNPGAYLLKVSSPDACKVGFSDDDGATYTKLEAVDNGDGTYSFKISAEQYEALVNKTGKVDVVKAGDVNSDGKVNATDLTLAKRALKGGAFTLSGLQKFAAEVEAPADTFDEDDVLAIRRVAAKFAKFEW